MKIQQLIAPYPKHEATTISDSLAFVPKLFKAIGEFFHNFQTTLLKWAIEWLSGPPKAKTPPQEATFNNELQKATQAFLKSQGVTISPKKLGTGFSGTVYAGYSDGKEVAVKIMNNTNERFDPNEGEAIALDLPKRINAQKNIALILFDQENQTYHYVDKIDMISPNLLLLPIVATISTKRLGNATELPLQSIAEAKEFAQTTAHFLEAMYEKGIIYADLKLENTLYYRSKKSNENKIKFHDFGISKKYNPKDFSISSSEAYQARKKNLSLFGVLCSKLFAFPLLREYEVNAVLNLSIVSTQLQQDLLTPSQIIDLIFKDLDRD